MKLFSAYYFHQAVICFDDMVELMKCKVKFDITTAYYSIVITINWYIQTVLSFSLKLFYLQIGNANLKDQQLKFTLTISKFFILLFYIILISHMYYINYILLLFTK